VPVTLPADRPPEAAHIREDHLRAVGERKRERSHAAVVRAPAVEQHQRRPRPDGEGEELGSISAAELDPLEGARTGGHLPDASRCGAPGSRHFRYAELDGTRESASQTSALARPLNDLGSHPVSSFQRFSR
jgi:hypothetical protein